jgi:serine/threonine-protein kinase
MIYLAATLLLSIAILFFLLKKSGSKHRPVDLPKASRSELIRLKEVRHTDLPATLKEELGERFRDISLISAGGMGVIARAEDRQNGRRVAIKTVLPELKENEKAVRLFFAECNAVKTMNHPNIVRIYEVGESDVLYYYVMEFLEGENLKTLLKREKTLSVKKTVSIGTQVARALQHCHDNRVIHRDIKPSNIFLTRNGTAKIIDFGIVKQITGDPSLATGSTRVGSPDFASPEQIQGQPVSAKCDIYSLGVCLFHLLSGKMPYKNAGLVGKMFDQPRNLKDLCPGVPDELVRVIHRCLDVDPKARFRAHELWAALRGIPPA